MGLLDTLYGNPDQTQAMGLLGIGMMGRNMPAGLQAAMGLLAQAPDKALERQMKQMQMENYKSEIAQRQAAIDKQKQIQEMMGGMFGGGGASAPQVSPGALVPSADGMGPTMPQSMAPQTQPGSRFANLSIDQIAGLHAAGGPDLLNAYKLAREGFERKPGSFYEDINGNRQYIADPTKGIDFKGGRVGVMPGFTDAQTQLTLATEAPKTLLSSAAQVNLRKNSDGTESPVSSLAENPTLQNVLRSIFPGQSAPAQAVPGAVPGPARATPSEAGMRAQVQGGMGADPAAIQRELTAVERDLAAKPLDAASKAQLSLYAADLRKQAAALPQGVGYGKTTAQETADAANKAGLVKTAEQTAADVAEQRKGIMSAAFQAPTNIAKYQQIGKLLENVDGGVLTPTGTHLASLANSLGVKIDKNLPNKEAAASLANEAALQLRSPAGGAGMPGAMSDQDRQFLASMTPNMAQSAQGRKQVIDAYVAVQKRNQQIAEFARKYEGKHGRLDNGFFDQLQNWSNATPLFGGK